MGAIAILIDRKMALTYSRHERDGASGSSLRAKELGGKLMVDHYRLKCWYIGSLPDVFFKESTDNQCESANSIEMVALSQLNQLVSERNGGSELIKREWMEIN